MTSCLEAFDSAAAGRRLAGLIDDLSNWYVRRSRRRFWAGPWASPDGAAAFATLHEALLAVTTMLAPVTPFLSDYLWGVLRAADAPASAHLAAWPACDEALIDEELSAQMALTRRLVELGRSARSAATVRTRQPLARALAGAAGFAALPGELRDLIADELNVHAVDSLDVAGGDLVSYAVKPEFRSLGRRFGSSTQAVAAAIRAADPRALADGTAADGSVSVPVPSVGTVTLTAADLVVTQTPLAGWGVASLAGETVALDLTVTAELRAEGRAREVVRLIQEARKSSGLDVTDRIAVRWAARDEELASALAEHAPLIAGEVLAESFGAGNPVAGDAGRAVDAHGEAARTAWRGRAMARARGRGARPALLARRRRPSGLIRGLAGGAGGAAVGLRLSNRQPLDVVIGHEADQDAVRLVVPGHAGQHGHHGGRGVRPGLARGRRLAVGVPGLRLGGPGLLLGLRFRL